MNAMVRNLSARLSADIDSFHESEGVAGCSTVLAHDMLKMIDDMAATAVNRNRIIRRLRRRGDDRQIAIIDLRRKLAWALESSARQRANNKVSGPEPAAKGTP